MALVVLLPALPVMPITRSAGTPSRPRRISVVTVAPPARAASRKRFCQGFGTAGLAITTSAERKSDSS